MQFVDAASIVIVEIVPPHSSGCKKRETGAEQAHLPCSDRGCCGDRLSVENRRRVECVADVTGAWLDAMPTVSNCVLGDGSVASSLLYMLGVCPAAMHDKPFICEWG